MSVPLSSVKKCQVLFVAVINIFHSNSCLFIYSKQWILGRELLHMGAQIGIDQATDFIARIPIILIDLVDQSVVCRAANRAKT